MRSHTGDEEYIKKRQEQQQARLKSSTTLAQNRQDFANEVSEGLVGIFAKPMAGFSEVWHIDTNILLYTYMHICKPMAGFWEA
jgi:hypothetical protein